MIVTAEDLYFSRDDSWYWIKNFCYTFDEHDQTQLAKKKPFPPDWEVFPYLFGELDAAYAEARKINVARVLLVPKSRQVMASWSIMAWSLHRALFFSNVSIIIQSKKEEDSCYQLRRQKHIYENLPQEFIDMNPPVGRPSKKLIALSNGSRSEAVAQGDDIVRSRVPTIFISDESAFQDEFDDSFNAALDCSQLIICLSSASPGYFQRIVEDTDGEVLEGTGDLPANGGGRDGKDVAGWGVKGWDSPQDKDGRTHPGGHSGSTDGRGWRLVR